MVEIYRDNVYIKVNQDELDYFKNEGFKEVEKTSKEEPKEEVEKTSKNQKK